MKMVVPEVVTVLVAMASVFVGFGISPLYTSEAKAKTKTKLIAPTTQVQLAAGPTSPALTTKPKDAKLIPRARTTRLPIFHTKDPEANKFLPASPSGASQKSTIKETIGAEAAGTSALEVQSGEDCNILCQINKQEGYRLTGGRTCTALANNSDGIHDFCSKCCRVAWFGTRHCVADEKAVSCALPQKVAEAFSNFAALDSAPDKQHEAAAAAAELADAALAEGKLARLAEVAASLAGDPVYAAAYFPVKLAPKRVAVYAAAAAAKMSPEAAKKPSAEEKLAKAGLMKEVEDAKAGAPAALAKRMPRAAVAAVADDPQEVAAAKAAAREARAKASEGPVAALKELETEPETEPIKVPPPRKGLPKGPQARETEVRNAQYRGSSEQAEKIKTLREAAARIHKLRDANLKAA